MSQAVKELENIPSSLQGNVTIVAMKPQQSNKKRLTVREFLNSDIIGMWKDRTDITDSSIYARQLRKQAQTRNYDRPRQ